MKQIKSIKKFNDGNSIQQVYDGTFNHSGSFLNDVCFPMDMNIKMISEHYKNYDKKLNAINDDNIIPNGTFSKVYRTLVDKWVECCNDKDDVEKIKKHYSKLEEWYILLISGTKGLRKIKIDNIENS